MLPVCLLQVKTPNDDTISIITTDNCSDKDREQNEESQQGDRGSTENVEKTLGSPLKILLQ